MSQGSYFERGFMKGRYRASTISNSHHPTHGSHRRYRSWLRGLPLAVEWARAGFLVTGIDISSQRVALCKQGTSWIADVSSDDLAILVQKGCLTATTDTTILAELDVV